MLMQKNGSIFNLTVTKHEAVELVKKLVERLDTRYAGDVFNVAVSDITEEQHYPGVLRVEVIQNQN